MSVNFGDLKVLVVEDQNDARRMLRHMLGMLGVTQVFEASDGCHARQFMDTAFDLVNLVVCDWNMPNMSVLEFLRQIRTVEPDMPFLITGRGDKNSVLEAKTSGVAGYIVKPFSSAQLEVKLRVIMQKKMASVE